MKLWIIALLTILVFEAEAAPSVRSTYRVTAPRGEQFRDFTRVAVAGGIGMASSSKEMNTFTGSVTASFGRGMFTAEAGAAYLKTKSTLQLDSGFGATFPHEQHSQYIGLPVAVKVNYIEARNASFFGRAGIMPALMVDSTNAVTVTGVDGASQDVEIGSMDFMLLAGFGGTAPIDEEGSILFLIDFGYFHGLSELDAAGTKNGGFSATAGLVFGI